MLRETSHGPRSMPERTSARGAGTRQAPCRHASHISSHEASNATDRPARTRSPGPSGASWQNIRASASTKAAALRWVTATPFGVPVEPEVKMIHASSSRFGPRTTGVPDGAAVPGPMPSSVTMAVTCASENTSSARSSGSSASTGTYAAPAARMERIVTYRSLRPEVMRTPTLSPAPTPASFSAYAPAITASASSAYSRIVEPSSIAGASGCASAVLRSRSTRVRAGGACDARRNSSGMGDRPTGVEVMAGNSAGPSARWCFRLSHVRVDGR